jgi:transcriptional regulator with XRE-family HTH domain
MTDELDEEARARAIAVDQNAKVVSERVRALRIRFKWRQDDLAAATGIPRGTISGIETGAGTSREYLIALAMAFGVPVSVLIGEAPIPNDVSPEQSPQKIDLHKERILLSIWRKLAPQTQDNWLRVLRDSFGP